jgi:hypothetical protein
MDNPEKIAAGILAKHSPRRLNSIAKSLNAKTYLEIGVNKGHTFFNIDMEEKTAVDPKFLFDVNEYGEKGMSFNNITSDNFFATLPEKQKYDIIFLDGLHTFEQTYRDLCNSLLHAHDKTIFMIDDTRPIDVYSSFPEQKKAVDYRIKSGGQNRQWHGDVYKVVFALHDFHPGLNYRTIIGAGNPQTLVWRSNKGWRTPRFNSMETISRMSYFNLLDHIDVLRFASEEDALNLCNEELRI